MTWTPRGADERAAVVALCVETVVEYSSGRAKSLNDAAERTVPPVSTPEPEYRTYKGVHGYSEYRVCDGVTQSRPVQSDEEWQNAALISTADLDGLVALKANPVKVATVGPVMGVDGVAWPQTLDGMAWAIEFNRRFPSVAVDDALGWFCNAIMRGVDSTTPLPTPATVASEPVCYANICRDSSGLLYPSKSYAVFAAGGDDWFSETAVPLYRHPATEAEALAVLEGRGWKEQTAAVLKADGTLLHYHETHGPNSYSSDRVSYPRVLIAPEGK